MHAPSAVSCRMATPPLLPVLPPTPGPRLTSRQDEQCCMSLLQLQPSSPPAPPPRPADALGAAAAPPAAPPPQEAARPHPLAPPLRHAARALHAALRQLRGWVGGWAPLHFLGHFTFFGRSSRFLDAPSWSLCFSGVLCFIRALSMFFGCPRTLCGRSFTFYGCVFVFVER